MKKSLLIFCFIGVTLISNIYGQVGIYTDNPQATLDVNGNVRIQNVPKIENTKVANQLFWNKKTGEVQLRQGKKEKPFYVLEYRLFSAKDRGHLTHRRGAIYDYNTQIPSDKYEVLITDVYPMVKDYDGNDISNIRKKAVRHVTPFSTDTPSYENCTDYKDYVIKGPSNQKITQKVASKLNPVRRTICEPINGKWHITLEYVRAAPPDGYHLQWHVRILAINKNFAESRSFVAKADPNPYVETKSPTGPTGELDQNPLERTDNLIR